MFLAQKPDSHGECEPDEGGKREDHEVPGARQPDPEDQGESGKADATHGCAERVDDGDDAAAIGSVEANTGFVQFLVRFNEACACGKDGGKGKEEATDGGAEFLRDQAGDYAYCAAE